MPGQVVGSLVGAVFGLVYVLVNTGPLPGEARGPLRVLGVMAFVAVVVALVRGRDRLRGDPGGVPHGPAFGRSYWLVVAAEVVALWGGLRVLNGPLELPHAGVAWVSLVVGAHFFALAVVFRQSFFHGLGAAIAVCGAVGLGLVVAGSTEAPIAFVSGVVPGVILLAAGWWGMRRDPGRAPTVGTPQAHTERA